MIRKTRKADENREKYKKTEHEQSRQNICVWGKNISDLCKARIPHSPSPRASRKRKEDVGCCWLISIPIKHLFASAGRGRQSAGENLSPPASCAHWHWWKKLLTACLFPPSLDGGTRNSLYSLCSLPLRTH